MRKLDNNRMQTLINYILITLNIQMKEEMDFNNFDRSQHNNYEIHIDESFHQEEVMHQNQLMSNYDQKILKNQFVQKFKNYRNSEKDFNQKKKSIIIFIRSLLINILYFLQQIWLQIIPQSIRGVSLGQKSQSIMDKFNILHYGDIIHWLLKLRQRMETFCIIVEDNQSINVQTSTGEFLFDQSRDSTQKLKFLLQFQAMSLTSKDLKNLQKDCHIDITPILQFKTYPVLLFCRYNFVQEFSIVGSLQITNLKRQDFEVILEQVKQHIRIIRQLQKQAKIHVFQHQKSPKKAVQLQQIPAETLSSLQS